MVKLNRTSEYGLIALRHMFRKQKNQDSSVTSAREVSDHYVLPFEITAKTLQRLKDTGLIQSAQGARGGYTLNSLHEKYTFGAFIEAMEGPVAIVNCAGPQPANSCACEYIQKCGMTDIMSELNGRMKKFLSGISLLEILEGENASVSPAISESPVENVIDLNAILPAAQAASVPDAMSAGPKEGSL